MGKLQEMKQNLLRLKDKMQAALDANNLEKARQCDKEIADLKDTIILQEKLDKEEEEEMLKKANERKGKEPKDAVKNFCNAARNGFPINNMIEGSKEDGGYTVPEDIQTRIERYRESKDALQPLVTVLNVKAPSGQRTFKKRSQQTGFTKVAEGGKIGAKETPKFERQSYAVEKYAGYFPVTSELLSDSDANIVSELVQWIGDESRVTRNKLIIDAINTRKKTEFSNLDEIKKALNVTLDAAFKNSSTIVTNQDGLQYFDTLKNKDGDYLLQPVVGDATHFTLFGKPVHVISNKDLPSDTGTASKRKIPVILGDLKEGIVFYNKKKMNIKSSDVAMNAFEEDMTLFRAIEREDVKVRDGQAFVNGMIVTDDTDVEVTKA